MRHYLARMFGISFVITLVVEGIVAFLFWAVERVRWGMRRRGVSSGDSADGGKRDKTKPCGRLGNRLLLAVLVNLLTNPAAVLLCWLGRIYLPVFPAFPVQVLVEIIVVAVEARIYRSFAGKPGWEIGNPVALAVVANVCSWGIGLVADKYAWLLDFLLRMR